MRAWLPAALAALAACGGGEPVTIAFVTPEPGAAAARDRLSAIGALVARLTRTRGALGRRRS